MTASATFHCGACGDVASTVTLVEPGHPDLGLTPGPPGTPPGAGTIFSSMFPDQAQLSIAGGPVSMTHGFVSRDSVAAALDSGDAGALYAIDPEYAPFWCPRCHLSYCGEHFRSWVTYDDGFYDATYGVCPRGHERKLSD